MKNGGKFLKICFTHEKIGGKFLKIFFTHETIGGKFGTPKIQKSKVLKIKIRSAQIVGEVFYAGEKRPRPIWGPPGSFFAWAGKIQKLHKFYLFSLVGPRALFTWFGAGHWSLVAASNV